MKNKGNQLSVPQLVSIGFIFIAVTLAWLILGGTLTKRNDTSSVRAQQRVTTLWGAPQNQEHPKIWYYSNLHKTNRIHLQPTSSKVDVQLDYEPKKKGLTWNRTYLANFSASYEITNPNKHDEVIYVTFDLPSEYSSYHNFTFKLGTPETSDVTPEVIPDNGKIKQQINVSAGESVNLLVTYSCRGMDQWRYWFDSVDRIQDFKLTMQTNFPEIDFLDGSGSPTNRDYDESADTWTLIWDYPNVINPQNISMDMPSAKTPSTHRC